MSQPAVQTTEAKGRRSRPASRTRINLLPRDLRHPPAVCATPELKLAFGKLASQMQAGDTHAVKSTLTDTIYRHAESPALVAPALAVINWMVQRGDIYEAMNTICEGAYRAEHHYGQMGIAKNELSTRLTTAFHQLVAVAPEYVPSPDFSQNVGSDIRSWVADQRLLGALQGGRNTDAGMLAHVTHQLMPSDKVRGQVAVYMLQQAQAATNPDDALDWVTHSLNESILGETSTAVRLAALKCALIIAPNVSAPLALRQLGWAAESIQHDDAVRGKMGEDLAKTIQFILKNPVLREGDSLENVDVGLTMLRAAQVATPGSATQKYFSDSYKRLVLAGKDGIYRLGFFADACVPGSRQERDLVKFWQQQRNPADASDLDPRNTSNFKQDRLFMQTLNKARAGTDVADFMAMVRTLKPSRPSAPANT